MARSYNVGMKAKALVAALLALFVGTCSCLVPLAAAASKQDHSCCPSPVSQDKDSSCCLRAIIGTGSVSLAAPQLYLVGLAHATPRVVSVAQEILRLDSAALSPPSRAFVASRSSRSPPPLLA